MKELLESINNRKLRCFVETGTFKAETTFSTSSIFETVHTFELCEQLYFDAIEKAKAQSITNVQFHLGDTAEIFDPIISEIDEDVLFYLDAHKIFGKYAAGVPIVSGIKDVPLMEELTAINKRNRNDIIVIDDVKLFGRELHNVDWRNISTRKVLGVFSKIDIAQRYRIKNKLIIDLVRQHK